MTSLPAASLPHVISAPNMDVTIAADATFGVRMTQVDHTTGGSFVWATAEAGTGATYVDKHFDGRLWSLECLPLSQPVVNNPVVVQAAISTVVSPANAAEFQAFDVAALTGTSDAILLEWRRCTVPGYRDEFWVRVLIDRASAGATKIRFKGWFGRHRGGELTADRFLLPCLSIENPTAPRATESYVEASQRTRILVPIGISVASPGNLGHNTPLSTWVLQPATGFQTAHPNPLQQLQFFSIAAMDAQHAASFRRMLHCQSEDSQSYHKQFIYKMVHNAGATKRMFGGAHAYIPPYISGLAGRMDDEDGHPPDSWQRNEWETPYYVTLESLTAASDATWFDSCKKYRSWAVSAYGPLQRRYNSSELRRPGKGPSILISFNTFDIDNYSNEVLADEIVSTVSTILDCMSPTFEPLNVVVQLQCPNTWGQAVDRPRGAINGPGSPVPQYPSGIKNLASRLRELGVFILAPYIRPGDMPLYQTYGDKFRWSFGARNRSGYVPETRNFDPDGTLVLSNVQMDLAHPGYVDFFTNEAVAAAMSFDMNGLYLDTFGGVDRSFPRRISGPRAHPANGGRYQHPAIDQILDAIERKHPKWIGNETSDEQMIGRVDFTQPDYSWPSGQLFLAERACDLGLILVATPVTSVMNEANYPAQARELNPPVWQACWNGINPSLRLIRPMTDSPLSTSALHPGPDLQPGLTDAQFQDLELFARGSALIHGSQPTFFDAYIDQWNDTLEKTSTSGLVIWGFLRLCYDMLKADAAGPYLINGDMERPLVVDLLGSDVTRKTNPFYVAAQNVNLESVRPDNDFPLKTNTIGSLVDISVLGNEIRDFEVPEILHSVWVDPDDTGRIGILLINWSSNASAKFLGSYTPSLYPGSPTGSLRQWTPGDPSTAAIIDTVAGVHTIGVGAVVADTVVSLPARSMTFLTIG